MENKKDVILAKSDLKLHDFIVLFVFWGVSHMLFVKFAGVCTVYRGQNTEYIKFDLKIRDL